MLDGAPFGQFMAFSDWLYETTQQTHKINLDRLFALIFEWLQLVGIDRELALGHLRRDYEAIGSGRMVKWLQPEMVRR